MTTKTTSARRGANRSRNAKTRGEFASIASRAFNSGFNEVLATARGRTPIRQYLKAMRAHIERTERKYWEAQGRGAASGA